MIDPKRAILQRRARFLAAGLAGLGCSPSAKPVATGPTYDITIPPLQNDGGPTPAPPADTAAALTPDRDGDGILDADDACPDHPGRHHVDPKQNGCPAVVVSVCLSIVMPPKITFGPNATTPLSTTTIEMVAETMKNNPQVNVEIEGHTDPTENSAIGAKRADAVKAELVRRGVDQARLTTTNAGATKPLVPNTSDVNRAKNRRVELIVK